MPQIIDAKKAASLVKEGDRIMFGGFLACGAAENLIDELHTQGTKNLHGIVICTDFEDRGMGKLIANKQLKSVQTSHIGTNKQTQAQFNEGTLDVEFNPQGTLSERVRAAGAGLGGILTPTGVGTDLDRDHEIIKVDGKDYFLATPIHGDFAFVRAHKADKLGNLIYSKSARNFNPIIATAAKTVIAEVDEIVEVGDIDPESVITPGFFVDYLVEHKD